MFPIDRFGFFSGEITGGLIASSIQIFDQSQVGYISYAAGYSAANLGGSLGYFYGGPPFDPTAPLTVTGGLDIYSIAGNLHPPESPAAQGTQADGLLVVTGVPPGYYDYDPKFEVVYPTIPEGTTPEALARERKLVVESSLWQDEAMATALQQYLFWEANKSADVVQREVRFDPFVPPGYWMDTDDMLPRARYDAVEWQVSDGAPTMALHGWVPAN